MASSGKRRDARREGALLVLFTAEERAIVDAAADYVGLTSGAFVRASALRDARKVEVPTTKKKEGSKRG